MNSIQTILPEQYPLLLREALASVKDAPKRLYLRGELPSENNIFLTVVGSRRYTEYGKTACETLIAGLRGLPVVIVSGLAFGIDSIAHEAALANGLKTVAVPGSGLADEMIYPAAHIGLARRVLAAGGCLLSPFPETVMGNNWTFPYRNGIMAGIAHATLVIEATAKSGTTITANHALAFSRNLLVVPGSIFSSKSAGPNKLLRQGAAAITCVDDLIFELGLENIAEKTRATRDSQSCLFDIPNLSDDEKQVITFLDEPIRRDALIDRLNDEFDMDVTKANTLISSLEIKGLIKEIAGEFSRV